MSELLPVLVVVGILGIAWGGLMLFTIAKQLQGIQTEVKELSDRLFEEGLHVEVSGDIVDISQLADAVRQAIEQGIWAGARSLKP
jgi:hypothetical protein